MDETEEDRFYAMEFEKYMAGRAGADMDWTGPEKHVQSNQREVRRRLPYLDPYIDPSKTALEIGCSSGFMLMALKERGMQVHGIDPSGGFIDFVRAKGIECVHSIEELRRARPGTFDLIIHYYVFEHIRHPVDFIRQYMDCLAPGGTMVFEVPCASDPLSELYQVPEFDQFYWSVAHHWYFTRPSLARVLERAGVQFELLPEQRYDISNHMVWMRDGKPGGYGRYADIFGPELDALYKQRLKDAWYCDTLVAVIHKPRS
jgi:SAM-dependent methyltransferase